MDRSPRFVLEFDVLSGDLIIDKCQHIHPEPYKSCHEELTLFIFGSPIINSIVDKKHIAQSIVNKRKLDENYLKSLDGEFLFILVNKKNKTLELANDRFSSFPMFFLKNGNTVLLSHAYVDILEKINASRSLHFKGDVLFEYLWFRRVFNDRTYDKYSKYLKPARIINFSHASVSESVYWRPKFIKNNNSLQENSLKLKELLNSSLEKKLSDISTQNIGLFLSGGMDTRTVLSLFQAHEQIRKPHCFTIGYSESGEYRVAKKLTEISKNPHDFIRLNKDFYDDSWDEKLNMTGGLYNQYTILFSGYSKLMSEKADIFFHGHALDYMFQGMYLPTEQYKLFGKKTYFKKVNNLNKITNFGEYFANNISFRAWRIGVGNYLLPKYKNDMIEELYNKIDVIAEEGMNKGGCNDNYDLWEYLMIHTPSRHYSQTDIVGMGANGEQRKIANDNALFDFYTSLPLKHRLYARVMRGALRESSSEFSNIISANTGFKIDSGPAELTKYFAKLKALRVVSGNKNYRHPGAKDRTWPDLDFETRIRPNLRNRVINLPYSEPLRNAMPFFDFNKLERDIDLWINHNKPGGGLFLTSLLTIDNLVKRF